MTSEGDKVSPTLRHVSESTPCDISFEDLKLGLGQRVEENSIVTFSTEMKDSIGATVDRFSYELASHQFFLKA